MRNRYAVAGKIGSLVLSVILAFSSLDLTAQFAPEQRLQAGQLDLSSQRVGQVGAVVYQAATERGGSPNALCAGATVSALQAGTPVTVTGNNSGSVFDDIIAANVVWEGFTVTACSNVSVSYCGTTPAFTGALITLVVGCPLYNLVFNTLDNVSSTTCVDGNFTIVFPDLPAATYYYPVLQGAGATGPYSLTLTATPCSTTFPANARCNAAIGLVPGEVCTPVTGTVEFATRAGNTVNGCGNSDAADGVWYTFEATATSQSITVVPSEQFNAQFEVFSGDCLALTRLSCAVGADFGTTTSLGLGDLTVGETYHIRVSDWYAGPPRTSTFTICIRSCGADAGTLTADETTVCFIADPVTISASENAAPAVPAGFEVTYVLTSGTGLVIEATGAEASFEVGATGLYTIHTLVYDPATLDLGAIVIGETTGANVIDLLVQGGGTICGNLGSGAQVTVEVCGSCPADAGTLTASSSTVCFAAPEVTISATANGDAVVPSGFLTLYLLTSGQDLVIEGGAFTGPSFTVPSVGDYTIHTLIYDEATLDLGGLVFGESTAGEVNALLVQGGGTICASLDLVGAPVTVEVCGTCPADAGTLTADEATVCFEADPVTISATQNDAPTIPSGFAVVYVLTASSDLVIVATNTVPTFNVPAIGQYGIHTLVHDPATLALSTIVLEETTGADVDALLEQGGGTICGSLDVTGATVMVEVCLPTCDADAGTLTAASSAVCFVAPEVNVSATIGVDAVVPVGYETLYLLTSGPDLVIVQAAVTPSFIITALGEYTLHTLVYDPTTLDLGTLTFGESTGLEVNALLIQGGGTICASLDVAGAPVTVADCAPVNDDCSAAIELPINAEANCPAGAILGQNIFATEEPGNTPDCAVSGAYFADVWYTFSSGANTEVTLGFDPLDMDDWGISVSDACSGGTVVYCAVSPDLPVVIATTENTIYWIRIFSNTEFGIGGEFSLCLSGAVPTFVCDGGEVATMEGETTVSICQDGEADVIDFVTTTNSAENYGFVVTDESNTIVTLMSGNSLDFNSVALGNYRVWGISYNGDLEGAAPGSLATAVTSTGDCLELSANFVAVNVEICSGITINGTDAWSVFPNPANGAFNVRFSGAKGNATIEIIDMDGRLVLQESTSVTNGQVITVNTAGRAAAGLYTVRLTSGNAVANVRLMVQ